MIIVEKLLPKDKLVEGYERMYVSCRNTTKSMTAKQEDILTMYIEGWSLESIAEEVCLSISGVMYHLMLVNNKIKYLLHVCY